MDKYNLDLNNLLLLSLVVKAVIDGGSFPIAIAVVGLLAAQSFKAFLGKKKDTETDQFKEQLAKIEEDLSSVKSKLALTLGSNRMK